MEAYSSQKRNEQSLFMKFLAPAAWAIAAVIIMLALSWMLRTWSPVIRPAAIPTETQAISFETGVREGDICKGPLAAAHGFDVFLTNSNKTAFVSIDPEKSVGGRQSIGGPWQFPRQRQYLPHRCQWHFAETCSDRSPWLSDGFHLVARWAKVRDVVAAEQQNHLSGECRWNGFDRETNERANSG